MAQIIDGKALAKKIRVNLKEEVEELKSKGINPKLAVIMVGDNPASKVYVKNKSKACEEIGVAYEEFLLDESVTGKWIAIDFVLKQFTNPEYKVIDSLDEIGFIEYGVEEGIVDEEKHIVVFYHFKVNPKRQQHKFICFYRQKNSEY